MDQETEHLLYSLTNFYYENIPIDSAFEKVLRMFIDARNDVGVLGMEVDKDSSIRTAKTVQHLPFFKLEIAEGWYNEDVRRQVESYGTFDEKIQHLDTHGYYIELTFDTITPDYHPVVFDLELSDRFPSQKTLSLYDHFFLRGNKIYLLPLFFRDFGNNLKHLFAYDIYINDFSLEKKWGSLYQIYTDLLLPRYQYRDVLESFSRLLHSDLTISDIKNSVSQATGWINFDIEDYHSPGISEEKKRMYDDYIFSPSDFLVTMPEEIISDKLRINIVLALLNEAREVQTSFRLMFDVIREDTMKIESGATDVFTDMKMGDAVHLRDGHFISKVSKVHRDFFFYFHAGYDMGFVYDESLIYDANYKRMQVLLDEHFKTDEGYEFDAARVYDTDSFVVRHVEFPEIPRAFSAVPSSVNGEYVFTCDPNTDGTKTIELLGSNDPIRDYVVVDSIINSTEETKITFTHDANLSGKRYYKVRGKADDYLSLKSLPIDIETI